MRKTFAVAVFAALFLAPVAMPASAQVYINVAYSPFDLGDGADPRALTGRVGYDFNRYFAVEGEGSFGIIDEEGLELNSDFGGYVLAKLPLADRFHVFGRAGYAMTTSTVVDDDNFAWGIGGQYNWGKSGLRMDWTRRDYDEDPVDSWSVGYAYTF